MMSPKGEQTGHRNWLQNEALSQIGGKVLSKPLKSVFPGCNPTSYDNCPFS